MSTTDFDEVVEHYQRALGEFVKGNPEPVKMMFSHREDVTLANPIGPVVRGWEQVAATLERAASQLREGEKGGFEIVAKYVTAELAYIVGLDRTKAKVGARHDLTPFALRVRMSAHLCARPGFGSKQAGSLTGVALHKLVCR